MIVNEMESELSMLKKKTKALPVSKPKLWIRDVTLLELRECPETLQLFCDEIKEFAYGDKARDVDSFCREYRVRRQKLHEWRQELKPLDDALNELQEQVHIYRRMLWGERKLNDANFLRYAHLHSEEEAKLNNYHDERKKETGQEQGVVFIRDVPAIVTGKIKPREEVSEVD